MAKLTEENFEHESIRGAIKDWTHKEQVALGLFCAIKSICSYNGLSCAPLASIECVKKWLENPTEENMLNCKEAAADAISAAVSSYSDYAARDAVLRRYGHTKLEMENVKRYREAEAAYVAAYASKAVCNDHTNIYTAYAAYNAYIPGRLSGLQIINYINNINNLNYQGE